MRGFLEITVKRGVTYIPINKIHEIYMLGSQVMIVTDIATYEPIEDLGMIIDGINEATK